jgi:hypothetical protein
VEDLSFDTTAAVNSDAKKVAVRTKTFHLDDVSVSKA